MNGGHDGNGDSSGDGRSDSGAFSVSPVHATCIAINGKGVLLSGPSGSGKSDLALRLIDRGAILVSDDYTMLSEDAASGSLIASPPPRIAGMMEVRGVGIVPMPFLNRISVALMVSLRTEADPPVERLPSAHSVISIFGHDVAHLRLAAFHASAPLKVEYALKQAIPAVR